MYEVTVSNIGTVCEGKTFMDVYQTYLEYTRKSESGDGMASGEDVTLWNDRGEPVREFRGSLHTDDND